MYIFFFLSFYSFHRKAMDESKLNDNSEQIWTFCEMSILRSSLFGHNSHNIALNFITSFYSKILEVNGIRSDRRGTFVEVFGCHAIFFGNGQA